MDPTQELTNPRLSSRVAASPKELAPVLVRLARGPGTVSLIARDAGLPATRVSRALRKLSSLKLAERGSDQGKGGIWKSTEGGRVVARDLVALGFKIEPKT